MWRQEGVRSFYKGNTPRVAPRQAIVFAVYERVSGIIEAIVTFSLGENVLIIHVMRSREATLNGWRLIFETQPQSRRLTLVNFSAKCDHVVPGDKEHIDASWVRNLVYFCL
jgi:hypothetical protein